MQKIHVYAGMVQTKEDLPEWDGSILIVGRIPCVGEYVRVPDSRALEVMSVIHHHNPEDGTAAGVTVKA
ncbi:MAG TPA: hypothetical protein VJL10_09315 [Anaerolineales bacterium]|nr:hypothetical protein [Anaerolineales bacterium]